MKPDLLQFHAFAVLASEALDIALQRLELNDGEGEEAPFRALVAATLAAAKALPVNTEAAAGFDWPRALRQRINRARRRIDTATRTGA